MAQQGQLVTYVAAIVLLLLTIAAVNVLVERRSQSPSDGGHSEQEVTNNSLGTPSVEPTWARSVERPSAHPSHFVNPTTWPSHDILQWTGNLCQDPWRDDRIDSVDCECILPWQESARNSNANWARHHRKLKDAALYFGDNVDVVWLGDSIVEFINGTHLSNPLSGDRRHNNPAVFRQAFDGIQTLVVGSAGDTTNNLLYHLRHGVYAPLQGTKAWILTVGTNNLGMTQCSREATIEGILALVRFLKQGNASTTVIVHGMLPRGGPRQPNKYFLGRYWEWIQDINNSLRDHCIQSSECLYMQANTEWFLTSSSPQRIRADTMSDAIHPDTPGYRLWIPSVSSFVRSILVSNEM